jgi:3-methylcrotonyl-CoA carboxylase alpha subunit
VAGQVKGRRVAFLWGEMHVEAAVIVDGNKRTVFVGGMRHDFERHDPLLDAGDADDEATGGHLTAPMSGKVLALIAVPGAKVEKGAPLMVMEAMKMEHTIAAPAAGVVKAFHFAAGDQVTEGAELVDFEAAA